MAEVMVKNGVIYRGWICGGEWTPTLPQAIDPKRAIRYPLDTGSKNERDKT